MGTEGAEQAAVQSGKAEWRAARRRRAEVCPEGKGADGKESPERSGTAARADSGKEAVQETDTGERARKA